MTDAELVNLTRNGQRSAYEVLVCRWSARVVSYVKSKVHHQQVAEGAPLVDESGGELGGAG